MPIQFTVSKPRDILHKQWAYLVKRGRDNSTYRTRQFLLWLLGSTAIYLLFYYLSAVNDFISLKVISMLLLAMAWSVLVVWFIISGIGVWQSKRRFKLFLESFGDDELNYSVQIDDDKVEIVSRHQTYNLPWTEFTCFGIHDETVYVFNEVERMQSLYWDKNEIGAEAFSALLLLLQQKSITQVF